MHYFHRHRLAVGLEEIVIGRKKTKPCSQMLSIRLAVYPCFWEELYLVTLLESMWNCAVP